MVLGKPVVATDCGGTKELVVDDETGYLVSQGNAEELASRIIQLIDEVDLAAQFGEAGQKRIIRKFSLEKMTLKYAQLYREILRD